MEPAKSPTFFREFYQSCWSGAGVLYLGVLLASMAIGLWPTIISPPAEGLHPAPLPTLQTLAVGQTVFVFLVWPLVMLRRFQHGRGDCPASHALAMAVASLVMAAPFYIAAGFLADATVVDVLRTATLGFLFWPVGWAAGAWAAGGTAASDGHRGTLITVVLIAGLIAMGGLPLIYYVLLEFLPHWPHEWLWDFAPAALAWQIADRGQGLAAGPAWAVIAWEVIAIGAGLVRAAIGNCQPAKS
jgi:hypothetical protein